MIKQIFPGLICADDIAICADSRGKLQEMADICSKEGDKLGLLFSKEKSGITVFNDREPITVQSIELEYVGSMRGGITYRRMRDI